MPRSPILAVTEWEPSEVPDCRGMLESVADRHRLLDLHLKPTKAGVGGRALDVGSHRPILVALAHFDGYEMAHRLIRLVSHGDGRVHAEVVEDELADQHTAGLGGNPETPVRG